MSIKLQNALWVWEETICNHIGKWGEQLLGRNGLTEDNCKAICEWATSSLVTSNHRYTWRSVNGNKAAELLLACSFCCVQGQTVSRVPSPQSQWESDAENASGGRRESTVAIRTRYLSLDFFPVVNAPLLGASQCVCSSTSKTGPPSLKGKIGKEVGETQCGLYHLRTPARHWQLRNTTTYIRCHAALKTNTKNDSRHTVDV